MTAISTAAGSPCESATTAHPRGPTSVAAVVVLYYPSDAVVGNVTALLAQCARVVIVPNSPPGSVESTLQHAGCSVLEYDTNGGTAAGFNRGIRACLDGGSEEYVLLLDQDSRAPDGMVVGLVAATREGRDTGLAIAAVGPVVCDVKNANQPVDAVPDSTALVPVDVLVSSGTLVHRNVFATVGLMDEQLFIDGVDHEWCLRAAALGLRSYVVPAVRLTHDMGDRLVRIGGRLRVLHGNPVRQYYIIRNSLLLLRRAYLPRRWRTRQFARTLRRLVFYVAYSDDRARSVRYLVRALTDAARNRSGALADRAGPVTDPTGQVNAGAGRSARGSRRAGRMTAR